MQYAILSEQVSFKSLIESSDFVYPGILQTLADRTLDSKVNLAQLRDGLTMFQSSNLFFKRNQYRLY